MMVVRGLIALSLTVFLAACDQNRNGYVVSPTNKLGQPIIDRQFQEPELQFPGGEPRFMVFLKLNTPPLFSSVSKDSSGKIQVDKNLKEQILAEQEAKIAELAEISPDIRVLYRFKRVINALAVEAPQAVAEQINLMDVALVEAVTPFAAPETVTNLGRNLMGRLYGQMTSVKFIGSDRIHSELSVAGENGDAVAIRGQGVRVGIIDSGIDYTHQMFGGPANPAAYQSINPSQETDFFPNEKVVGGYDFAGGVFNPGSHLYVDKLPQPDVNPLDHGGHGTHVAGTVAGRGDMENTYDGVAPEATLYALKVFGDGEGGTMDAVVIAALEYAGDPNDDFNFDDKLDVLNLSLGGNFGAPKNLYGEAIQNITNAGTVVVAAAGNSGAVRNVVGAPSTVEDALSVAASIDGSEHIWKIPAVKVSSGEWSRLEEIAEGQRSRPVATVENPQGELFYIGMAATDLTAEQVAGLTGRIALIDRGQVSFEEKLMRAEAAGAIGVVVANSEAGRPFIMAGDQPISIPAVMITLELGRQIKERLAQGEVVSFNYRPTEMIELPEVIDTITSFSSQGPRDLDALIKPEITAPGYAIISAQMGSGNQGVPLFGTSMASPHVAGVAALAVQYRRDLDARQIKSLLMASGKTLFENGPAHYAVSRQGAGRIQAFEALTTPAIALDSALSWGKISVHAPASQTKTLRVQNIGQTQQSFVLTAETQEGMSLSLSPSTLALAPGEIGEVQVTAQFTVPTLDIVELDGFIQIHAGGRLAVQVPTMAVINRTTAISLEQFVTSAEGATVELNNTAETRGPALLFNILGKDQRKADGGVSKSVACDLESAGYRLIRKRSGLMLQVAVKLYNPVTEWTSCDVNMYFDLDGDGVDDKELWGTQPGRLPGLGNAQLPPFAALLVDSGRLQQLYQDYASVIALQDPNRPPQVDFAPVVDYIGGMLALSHSTVALVEVPVSLLGGEIKQIGVKVAVSYNGNDVVEGTDFLNDGSQWMGLSLNPKDQNFTDIPEVVMVNGNSQQSVTVKRGLGRSTKIVGYFPRNDFIMETFGFDSQEQIRELQTTPNTEELPPVLVASP